MVKYKTKGKTSINVSDNVVGQPRGSFDGVCSVQNSRQQANIFEEQQDYNQHQHPQGVHGEMMFDGRDIVSIENNPSCSSAVRMKHKTPLASTNDNCVGGCMGVSGVSGGDGLNSSTRSCLSASYVKTNSVDARINNNGSGYNSQGSGIKRNRAPQPSPEADSDSDLTRDFVRIFVAFISKYRDRLLKLVSIILCTALLSCAVNHRGYYYTPWQDVLVYCVVYSVWVITCLPWLLTKLDGKTIGLMCGALVRLFAADIGVLGWSAFRGDTHILHRGLRLKPMMEPSLSWLSDAGYSLRFSVLVAAVSASVVKMAIDWVTYRFHLKRTLKRTSSPLRPDRTMHTHQSSTLINTLGRNMAAMTPSPRRRKRSSPEVGLADTLNNSTVATSGLSTQRKQVSSLNMPVSERNVVRTDRNKKRARSATCSPGVVIVENKHGVQSETDVSENNSKFVQERYSSIMRQHHSKREKGVFEKVDAAANDCERIKKQGSVSDDDEDTSLPLSDVCHRMIETNVGGKNDERNSKKRSSSENRKMTKSKFTQRHSNPICEEGNQQKRNSQTNSTPNGPSSHPNKHHSYLPKTTNKLSPRKMFNTTMSKMAASINSKSMPKSNTKLSHKSGIGRADIWKHKSPDLATRNMTVVNGDNKTNNKTHQPYLLLEKTDVTKYSYATSKRDTKMIKRRSQSENRHHHVEAR